MIGVPFEDNDLTCLGGISEIIVGVVEERSPWLVELASRFSNTEDLVAWIRSLPQRDDEGYVAMAPRWSLVTRGSGSVFPAEDPNCVERSALYLAVAELLDPWPVRRLATLDFACTRPS